MSRWVSHDELRDIDWRILQNDQGSYSHDQVMRAIALDQRAELRAIRQLLQCHRIPKALDALVRIDRIGVRRRAPAKKQVKRGR